MAITIFPLQSRHRLLHRRVRGGDFLSSSHIPQLPFGVGGWADNGKRGARQQECRRTRSRDCKGNIVMAIITENHLEKIKIELSIIH